MVKVKVFSAFIFVLIFIAGCANVLRLSDNEISQNTTAENTISSPDTTHSSEINIPPALSDEDFIVKIENTYIVLGIKFDILLTNEKILNTRYADERHAYNTYSYENFIITTSPINDTILSITLVTPEFSTYRGIHLGTSAIDILEKYDLADTDSSGHYSYLNNGKVLTFYVDENGNVTKIELSMV